MRPSALRLLLAPVFLLLLALSPPAAAQVVATFYSHEFGEHFPHAFVTLKGRTVAEGTPVDTNYGFTAKSVTPAILFGSVAGRIDIADAHYITQSNAQFAVTLTDDQYRAMLAVVEKWGARKSPSYNLNTANCVHFIGEAARAAGLSVTFPKALMKKPRSYLEEVMRLNPRVTIVGH
jgi:hypothetical protein